MTDRDRTLTYVCPGVYGCTARKRLVVDVPRLMQPHVGIDTPRVRREWGLVAIRELRKLGVRALVIARLNGVAEN